MGKLNPAILCVDDNRDTLEFLSVTLKQKGYLRQPVETLVLIETLGRYLVKR
jgi:hypothetical protein